jgi:hypothetical protein
MMYVSILYKPMKNKFCMTIITKLWPMKFVISTRGKLEKKPTIYNYIIIT